MNTPHLPHPTQRPRPPTAAARAKPHHKGKTLAEIEEEEGGPVRESLAAMAHVRRAQQRRRAGAAAAAPEDETALPDDIAAAEEHYAGEDDDGDDYDGDDGDDDAEDGQRARRAAQRKQQQQKQKQQGRGAKGGELAPLPGGDDGPMTAFNLNDERQEGHFDEDGNFVFERKAPEDRDDAWLASDEGRAVVSAELRARIEARNAAMAAADAAPALGEAAVARAQLEMSRLMAPGETVAAALKRMRGGAAAAPKKGAQSWRAG